MPVSKLPSPTPGMDVGQLTDLMFRYYRELQYLLNGNLDEQNVRQITTDQLVAGTAKIGSALIDTITTDQITAGIAKISTALIENLVVGGNVTMGPLAAISWSQVTEQPTIITTADALSAWAASDYATYIDANGVYTGTVAANKIVIGGDNGYLSFNDLNDKPTIPTQYTDNDALSAWANSNYATYIDANGVYSGSFNGGMFNVNPTGSETLDSGITIGGWYNNGWVGQALQIKYFPDGDSGFPGIVISSTSSVPVIYTARAKFDGYVDFRSGSIVDFLGSIDFTGATVTGLTVPAVFS